MSTYHLLGPFERRESRERKRGRERFDTLEFATGTNITASPWTPKLPQGHPPLVTASYSTHQVLQLYEAVWLKATH
jgi:hypothetical protein